MPTEKQSPTEPTQGPNMDHSESERSTTVREMDHNASPQVGVDPNPDPILQYSHEHAHAHKHHGGPALTAANKSPEIMYSGEDDHKGRDLLDSPDQDYKTHQLKHPADKEDKVVSSGDHSYDEESGHMGSVSKNADESWHGYAYRRWKPFFHFFIWAVWTA